MNSFIRPNWPAPSSIQAFTSLRQGGHSQPPYDTFNLALHVADHPEAVIANRQQLHKLLPLPAEPIWLNQVHGTTVVEALPQHRYQTADASFTRQTAQVCAILTGDCLPILLCDQQGHQAAAIHAGWRGLAKGIISNTLAALAVPHQTLLAWLGPAIGPQQFRVGPEVYDVFCNQTPANQAAFTRIAASTWLANIYELARLQLRAFGISKIYGGNYCTYTESTRFFSFRRDQGKTGRMVSLIWMEGNR